MAFVLEGSTELPVHIKALKNCEQELATVDYNTVKRLLVTWKLLKDETMYESFDQLISEMITRQCPEGFFAQFCEVLKKCTQYERIAQMLIDEYELQLPNHNQDRYRQVLRSNASCILQEQSEAAYYEAVAVLTNSFSSIQMLYHAIIEMIKQASYQKPLEQKLCKNITELQAIKNNLGPHSSKEEINEAIKTLLNYLHIIVNIIEGALSSWFNAEEIAICHTFVKYLVDMVSQIDKEASQSLPELRKKFTQYCKRLENRIWYYKNGPFMGKLASIVVGAAGLCLSVGYSVYLVPIVILGTGGYCACEAFDQHFNKKIKSGEKKGEKLINKQDSTTTV